MSLTEFILGCGTDSRGIPLGGYLDAGNQWWESNHNHIQWAFPLPEPSKAQPMSPVATDEFYETVRKNTGAQMRMVSLTGRYLQFLDETNGWRRQRDHNHLRITRVLRCLLLCGLDDLACKVYLYCRTEAGDIVGEKVWRDYWAEAATNINPKFLQ